MPLRRKEVKGRIIPLSEICILPVGRAASESNIGNEGDQNGISSSMHS
jgi:hypothetical protein